MDPWNKSPKKSPWDKKQTPPNIDELLDNLQNQLKSKFEHKSFGFLLIAIVFILWALTGIFTVDPQERAIVKRFGVVDREIGPGPHYHLPFPIETVQKEKVTAVQRIEIGFRTIDPGPPARYRQIKKESLMLTGDENIVDIQFTVQYKIARLADYLYNVAEPGSTIRSAAESAMREVIGHTTVGDALTVGKGLIETTAAELLQSTLDNYQSGIHVANVKLQDVHPPDQVKEAFKDVASAKEDKEKLINEAEGYANNILPRARGEAVQIINEAKAYANKIVLEAEGKTNRFNAIYQEYKNAKDITKKRIQLETMEKIMPNANKVIADPQLGRNLLPFLPIQQLNTGLPTK